MRKMGLAMMAMVMMLALCGVGRSQHDSGEAKKRFAPVKVFIDPQGKGLGAYQFELKATGKGVRPREEKGSDPFSVKIVGVEGGEHAAYKEAPYYDPAALAQNRIIIGALSTAKELPAGRMRVATVHVMIEGDAEPEYEVVLVTAGDADGNRIDAKITLETGESK
jgi:hypothetical protein